jgi:hypothetical protein
LALELYGIPQAPKEHSDSPLAEARYLLKVAAEVEHGLLVQYLYATYSINNLPQAPDWVRAIRNIAIQEMDHLINVQNILLALKNDGSQTYFDRQNFPVPPEYVGYYPYAFRLEPLSADSLSKYVSAESPLPETICDPDLRTALEKIIARAERVSHLKTIGHVGNLYAYLYWLFLPSDSATGPWPDFPADWFRRCRSSWHLEPKDFADVKELNRLQADFAEFKANDGNDPTFPNDDPHKNHRWVFRVRSAAEALRAIAQIAIQGEGTEAADDSHFLEFRKVYDDVDGLPNGTSSHLAVPTNPNLRDDPATASGRIVNPETRCWARLCNTRYLMLLQKLPLALSRHRDDATENSQRVTLISTAFKEMTVGIGYLAKRLMGLPRANDPKEFAGPIFELPDEMLPSTTDDQWKELVRLIGLTADLLQEIRKLTGPGKPNADDEIQFQALEAADKAVLQLVSQQSQPAATTGKINMAAQLSSFADVKAFFDKFITDNGTDLSGSPHGDFWNVDYNAFVNGDVRGVPGVKTLVKGDAEHSNLILILRGAITVSGKTFERMPADGSNFMSPDLIASLADWINRGCPQ